MKARPNSGILRSSPFFIADSSTEGDVGPITANLPPGVQSGDLLLFFIESEGADPAPTVTGWTQLGTVTDPTAPITRLTVLYKFAGASEPDPTTSDTGDHQIGQVVVFRYVDPFNPFDGTSFVGVDTVSTTVTIAGVTTTGLNRMIIACATDNTDTNLAPLAGAWTNANLSNPLPLIQLGSTAGLGGGLAAGYGVKATAGAVGNTTTTFSNGTNRGQCCIALKGYGY